MVKNTPANAGGIRDSGLIPGLERSLGGEDGNPLQYSCLENPTDKRLAGYSPWGLKESHKETRLSMHTHIESPQNSS